jgi:hypothetical protein
VSDENPNTLVVLPVFFPVKGLVLEYAQDEQPELSTLDLLNCWNYDPRDRLRGCQRPGLKLLWSGAFSTPASSAGSTSA